MTGQLEAWMEFRWRTDNHAHLFNEWWSTPSQVDSFNKQMYNSINKILRQ